MAGWGKKNENEELGKKIKRGKEKGRKITCKKGVINLKKFRGGGSSDPPCTPAPPCRILIRRKLHKKRGKRP